MPNKGNRKPDRPSAEDSKEELANFMTPNRPTHPTPRRDTRLPSRLRGRPSIVQASGRPLQGVTQPQKTKIPKMKGEAQHKSQTSSSGLILPSEAAVPQKAQSILQETRGQQKATRRKNQIIRSERQKREENQKSKIRLPAELQLRKPLGPGML